MATFQLPPAVPEHKDPDIAAQEDNSVCIWAFSPRRTEWQLACAFLNAGYGRRKYRMYRLHDNPDGTLNVKFINLRDAHLLYGQAFHCGCEMVVFTGANIFTNYSDRFPNNGNFIHNVLPKLPMALEVPLPYPEVPLMAQEIPPSYPEVPPHYPKVPLMAQEVPPMVLEVPPHYPEVSMSQELAVSLELALVPMSRATASGTD